MRVIDCVQGSAEWLTLRRGVITGTKLEQAFKQSEALKNHLLAERMITYMPEGGTSADMDKGNALEPLARQAYAKESGNDGVEVGFILHPDRDDIGISPDWIIDDGKKAAEFKCPKWFTHIEYMRSDLPPKKYLFQLVHYFLCIPQLESIDFVSFDELNEVRPLDIKTFTLEDLLNIEYLKGKKIGTMENLQDKVFSFADSIHEEYNRLIF
jgi:hypothetical protein